VTRLSASDFIFNVGLSKAALLNKCFFIYNSGKAFNTSWRLQEIYAPVL